MRAALIDKPGNVRVGTIPDPTPNSDELIIRVRACGLCGPDLHIVDGDSPLVRYSIVLSHKFAGEVVAVGNNVSQHIGTRETKLTIGARVAVEPKTPDFMLYRHPMNREKETDNEERPLLHGN